MESQQLHNLEETVSLAWDIAERQHASQLYGKEPYFHHVFEVANLSRLMGYGHVVVAASLLHDSVEDTGMTLDTLRLHGFPESIVNGVDAVTFDDKTDNPRKLTGEARRLLKINKAMSNPVGHVVKFCDSSMNFASTASHPYTLNDAEMLTEYIDDYATNISILRNNLPSPEDVHNYIVNVDGRGIWPDGLDCHDSHTYQMRWVNTQNDVQVTRTNVLLNH